MLKSHNLKSMSTYGTRPSPGLDVMIQSRVVVVDIMPLTAGSYLLLVYFQTNQPAVRQSGVFLSSGRLCCELHQALN